MLTIFDGIKKVEKKSCEEMIIILSQLSSYLRSLMTKQCIKILIKANSMI